MPFSCLFANAHKGSDRGGTLHLSRAAHFRVGTLPSTLQLCKEEWVVHACAVPAAWSEDCRQLPCGDRPARGSNDLRCTAAGFTRDAVEEAGILRAAARAIRGQVRRIQIAVEVCRRLHGENTGRLDSAT